MSRFDPARPYGYELEERPATEEERKRMMLQEDEDLRLLMKTENGRRFVWRMLERTGVYRITFRTNSEGAFLEGIRSVGASLLADCHRVALEETILMMRENSTNG